MAVLFKAMHSIDIDANEIREGTLGVRPYEEEINYF